MFGRLTVDLKVSSIVTELDSSLVDPLVNIFEYIIESVRFGMVGEARRNSMESPIVNRVIR